MTLKVIGTVVIASADMRGSMSPSKLKFILLPAGVTSTTVVAALDAIGISKKSITDKNNLIIFLFMVFKINLKYDKYNLTINNIPFSSNRIYIAHCH